MENVYAAWTISRLRVKPYEMNELTFFKLSKGRNILLTKLGYEIPCDIDPESLIPIRQSNVPSKAS